MKTENPPAEESYLVAALRHGMLYGDQADEEDFEALVAHVAELEKVLQEAREALDVHVAPTTRVFDAAYGAMLQRIDALLSFPEEVQR